MSTLNICFKRLLWTNASILYLKGHKMIINMKTKLIRAVMYILYLEKIMQYNDWKCFVDLQELRDTKLVSS